jgi:ABC-type nitrate/sulfonate/bicarbonate transport system substrate-binding protein
MTWRPDEAQAGVVDTIGPRGYIGFAEQPHVESPAPSRPGAPDSRDRFTTRTRTPMHANVAGRVVRIVSMLAALACATLVAQPVMGQAPAKSLGSLVLGSGIDASYASIVAGVRKGFFKKHGIDAELKVFASGQEALDAVLTGQADFAGNGQYNVPLVAAKGGNIKIIAEFESSSQQFGAVAKSGIDKPQDLIGKKVGTQFNTTPEYYYRLYVRKYGLDSSKIDLINIQFAQMAPAIARGDIDAFFAFEPHLTRAMAAAPGIHILHRSGQDNVMKLRVYAGVSQKVYSNKELAVAFLRGLGEAGEWCNAHQDETAQLINQEFKIPIEDAKKYVRYFDYSITLDKASRDELAQVSEYLVQQKVVPAAPDLSKFVTTEFMQAAYPGRT